eukprot:CAMPEP_0116144318 /NCGR_PEP_ID=MMETSP0329-20121206/15943_1 /TAXON_ID=697910 /ORGANISM="Pseudo-nitzschia arenysensis, Strain B593" /LENGTH=1577 /DNA_ID=CAMNT_0003639743 /DNA_START=59 /DNA_END=4792 /DNA_ORIENTATION=-
MQDESSASWWNSGWSKRRAGKENESMEEEKALHQKRLAEILRYIASMHQDVRSSDTRFVREIDEAENTEGDFFQCAEEGNRVLFSTNDFRKLLRVDAADIAKSDQDHPPFSFYAPKASGSKNRGPSGASNHSSGLYGLPSVFSSNKATSGRHVNERGLWLRLKRLGPSSVIQRPSYEHNAIQNYLHDWLKESSRACSIEDLLTIHNLDRAPSIPNSVSLRNNRLIKSFLRRYKLYLRTKLYQQTLEPIYNSLFEWNQQQNENNEEIIWGLGHAKMVTRDGRLINGPLLEVLVEVELAPDGALLIRPREHTGVTLNREVVAAIVGSGTDASSQHAVLQKLHRSVGSMETSVLSPGQPQTYAPLLKRLALELSSGGTFHASADTSTLSPASRKGRKTKAKITDLSKLHVTEAWCLYVRSKPSSVWARDANLLADRVINYGGCLPMATWSLTHGSSKLENVLRQSLLKDDDAKLAGKKDGVTSWVNANFLSNRSLTETKESTEVEGPNKPIFPLATSESQDRIADLLLRQNYPAVIAEGPPGTGKTHTIANIVSAYLCEGKRVLVTSKNANALSVLRGRLPQSIRELVVDVSMSESQGMRQLQQTVERLAVRVSVASADIETEKCSLLQRSIDQLDIKLQEIDKKMCDESERVRQLLQHPNGIVMVEKASNLINSAAWLMRTLPKMSLKKLKTLANHVRSFHVEPDDSILSVMGFSTPPSQYLISLASAKSGSSLSSFSQLTKAAFASLPIIGASIEIHNKKLIEEINEIEIGEANPESKDDWATVSKALQHSLAVHTFEESVWRPLVKEHKWPHLSFKDQKVVKEVNTLLQLAVEVKELQGLLGAENAMKSIAESRKLDTVRTRLSDQKRHHSEELADAAVVAELSRSFSPDAQSALIKFAQIAGAAKFNRSAKPSKMSQRQRRRRQEYLTAFDRCCRFIPCWILTTSQISDYLPAECLFDLVVIDESSQSDVTVLPGMMRGKQWLIVGDGKQVSPTEAFVSEANMENLRATLPESPLEDALLPGRSFFDMCAQAFPRGRVVLHEHFRCAPEIISFSNELFYDGRLVPLRLPAKRDRFEPSIVDVRLRGGAKVGKVNEQEADKIVEMVREMMMDSSESKSRPRSIGIISLIGDEQSRLIRGRLLDSCGPEYLARHDVLIGDPPQFQGAERDVVFLSMVCSKQNCPTQNQQFHFQRANVALSRARDRVVLVRSIDLADIPSLDDAKVPIIEFFMSANEVTKSERAVSQESVAALRTPKKKSCFGREILETLLSEKGYQIVDMSQIWKNAFCVEHEICDARVAILVDCEEGQQSDWLHSYSQQKAIERVGWKCLRVDALSVVVDYNSVVKRVTQFLASHGIEKPGLLQERADPESEEQELNEEASISSEIVKAKDSEVIEIDDEEEATNTSNDEGERITEKDEDDEIRPDQNQSSADFVGDDTIEAWKFGEVVDLDFLRSRPKNPESDTESMNPIDDAPIVGKDIFPDRVVRRDNKHVKRSPSDLADEDDIQADTTNESDSGKSYDKNHSNRSRSRSRKRRKVSRSSRDGAWNPDDETAEDIYDDDDDWMDSDLDMRNSNH